MTTKIFATLYKKTTTGATQTWTIMVNGPTSNGYGVIVTRFGQLGTENPQEASDTITQGKNEGKTNATTAYEQAVKEAEARWLKKKKSGYVEEVNAAVAGEVDSVIEGGINPAQGQTLFNITYTIL